jgi:hypothetical protein
MIKNGDKNKSGLKGCAKNIKAQLIVSVETNIKVSNKKVTKPSKTEDNHSYYGFADYCIGMKIKTIKIFEELENSENSEEPEE